MYRDIVRRTLSRRIAIRHGAVELRRPKARTEMSQLYFGDAVRRHHQAHHRIGQHLFEKDIRHFPTAQPFAGPCTVEVGQSNGQGPRQSGMGCAGMQLDQHRGLPGFGTQMVRRRKELGLNSVLPLWQRLVATRNVEWPGEDGDGLTGLLFRLCRPLPVSMSVVLSAPFRTDADLSRRFRFRRGELPGVGLGRFGGRRTFRRRVRLGLHCSRGSGRQALEGHPVIPRLSANASGAMSGVASSRRPLTCGVWRAALQSSDAN